MSGVCYKKLFKLLIDKGLNKSQFAKVCGISTPTLAKLSKNENVSMDVLIKICKGLECNFGDIIDYIDK